MARKGIIKFGRTQRELGRRVQEHAGVLSVEKSRALFSLACKDAHAAEELAREMFQAQEYTLRARKELVTCTLEAAKAILRKAVAQASVHQVQVQEASAVAVPRPLCKNGPVAALLDMPLTFGNQTGPLHEWMRRSLSCSDTARKLKRAGVSCVNWSELAPRYRVNARAFHRGEAWLAGKGHFGPFPAAMDADIRWPA